MPRGRNTGSGQSGHVPDPSHKRGPKLKPTIRKPTVKPPPGHSTNVQVERKRKS